MKKAIGLLLMSVLAVGIFAGCSKEEPTVEVEETPDVVTTASIVNDGDALMKALSTDGTWIAATLGDITLTEDLFVEGVFINKEKVARKIAPYTQDADHNITESFTITAPKMIIKSDNTKFQGGTFKGDVYVEANGFQISMGMVDGNVYFASEEFKNSFSMDEASITGQVVTEMVDAVTTASIVNNAEAFVKALSADGAWIAATLGDITLTEDLIVEGEFTNKDVIARKIAPYTQDADHNITASFTITAPKMIVKSENTKFQGGTFVGDVYVEAKGFRVSKATIEGNVYFATQELMDAAIADETGIITGAYEVKSDMMQ